MKTILIHNTKGGIGKTAIIKNICQILSSLNKKCFIIDLNSNFNLSSTYGPESKLSDSKYWLNRFLNNNYEGYTIEILFNTISKTNSRNIDLAIGSKDINWYSQIFKKQLAPEKILGTNIIFFKKIFKDKYDYVFLDMEKALI